MKVSQRTKSRVAGVLLAFGLLGTVAAPVILATPAAAVTVDGSCTFIWSGPYITAAGNVKGVITIGCNTGCSCSHQMSMLVVIKIYSGGAWRTVSGTSSGWVDAPANNGTTVGTSPVGLYGSTPHSYRIELSHQNPTGTSVHYHQTSDVTLYGSPAGY